MKPNASLRPVSIVLAALLLAPVPAWAHSEGPPHAEPGQAQPASQATDSQAGMYRWKDDRGMAHYSQGLQSVPERFRDTAVQLGETAPSASQPRK